MFCGKRARVETSGQAFLLFYLQQQYLKVDGNPRVNYRIGWNVDVQKISLFPIPTLRNYYFKRIFLSPCRFPQFFLYAFTSRLLPERPFAISEKKCIFTFISQWLVIMLILKIYYTLLSSSIYINLAVIRAFHLSHPVSYFIFTRRKKKSIKIDMPNSIQVYLT